MFQHIVSGPCAAASLSAPRALLVACVADLRSTLDMLTALFVLLLVNVHTIAAKNVSSFVELSQAVKAGTSPIMITASEIVFPRQLHVHARASISIDSPVYAILSGGNATRLFVVHNHSSLSLRRLILSRGRCSECNGGAISLQHDAELLLAHVKFFDNHARLGGAIAAASSTVIATDCTMTANTASSGGAVAAQGNSTVNATNCMMSSNAAVWGGAVAAAGNSTVTVTGCTMARRSLLLLSMTVARALFF